MSYSGPYVEDIQYPNVGGETWYRYRQSKPWNHPLPYRHLRVKSTPGWNWGRLGVQNIASELTGTQSAGLYAKAYDRFYRRVGAKAQNMVNLVEAEKSLQMIVLRTGQLLSAARDVAHFRVPRVLKTGIKKPVHTSMSANWLEYTFGWVPLVNDIATSVEVLQREFDTARIQGSAKMLLPFSGSDGGSSGSGTFREEVRLRGSLRVDNPNLLLANQLGFVNPAAVVWDAVPFSFVVDWFLPVNAFLNSMSNDFGLSILDGCTTYCIDCRGSGWHIADNPQNGSAQSFELVRSIGAFPTPSLFSRAHLPQGSIWLAATSTALLIQQLQRFTR